MVLMSGAHITWLRIRRSPRGTVGAARVGVLSVASALLGISAATSSALLLFAAYASIGKVLSGKVQSLLFSVEHLADLPWAVEWVASAWKLTATLFALSTVLSVGAMIACWFLVTPRTRARIWMLVDAVLLGAFAFATWRFPLDPDPEVAGALAKAATRVALSSLVAVRLAVRAVDPILRLLERFGFRLFVAARHLRAKKTRFVATNAALSIAAIAVATGMLVTVLSVMGGFRNDLKKKILGNHAHIVVDAQDRLKDYAPIVAAAQNTPGVVGASPYLQGEVMLSSVANKAAAVLRGIEPDTVGDVTDLQKNLTYGKLEYLKNPARLLDPQVRERTKLPLNIEIPDANPDDEALALALTLALAPTPVTGS